MANYPVPYQNSWGFSGIGQQAYPQYTQPAPQTPTQQTGNLIWVDGEVGAKAYQVPAGIPANQPIALWDTNDTIIYLKSINQMGMPNPLQKAHYTLEEHRGTGPATSGAEQPDTTQYVRKEDMELMKQELMDAISKVNTGGSRRAAAKEE